MQLPLGIFEPSSGSSLTGSRARQLRSSDVPFVNELLCQIQEARLQANGPRLNLNELLPRLQIPIRKYRAKRADRRLVSRERETRFMIE